MWRRLNAYDRALLEMKERIRDLAGMVEQQLQKAMQSFVEQDVALAEAVIQGDDPIDRLEASLEMEALELISIQQPVDQDLRLLAAVMRIGKELERISDYACDIAETTLNLRKKGEWFKPLIDLPRMADLVQGMFTKSCEAFYRNDAATARQLDDDDQAVDELYLMLYQELTELMRADSANVDQGFAILLIVRYLERIGDHLVNVAEMTVFVATGERHPFKTRKEGLEQ
ncbi:PhoU-like phosphate uptake regulator [Hydrogenispora ethanolica]|uniref:Phosphate-specific transport system accessory protein PhoU n=1 Tax=Hydrogenispora ethanolica TaxID=1082276 RepID=A0A4R1R853_HYDET|nr:phosphate signaling complex protein PhoU [Hydrogenispora ethanolica]TCL61824.1 PhoU-like phosphate uptake regulator [Hydrogenispora ethanolica]